MQKKHILASAAIVGALASTAAAAQTADTYRAPWRGDFWGYVGASGGESKFDRDCDRTLTLLKCDHRDTAWKVYAGGKMNEVLGLEIGYTDFGRIAASGGETKAYAVPLSLVAGVPVGPVSVFAKVGGLYGHTNVEASAESLVDRGHKTGWGWNYGAGAGYNISPNVQIRAEYERYKLDFVGGRDDIDMVSAGLAFRF
jgi:OOP family OmpA-OmpF porin